MPGPNIFLWIFTSVTGAAVVNPNGIKILLATGLSTFPIKRKAVFSKSLPKNPNDCPVFCNWSLIQ